MNKIQLGQLVVVVVAVIVKIDCSDKYHEIRSLASPTIVFDE